jgi:hypothetical protein
MNQSEIAWLVCFAHNHSPVSMKTWATDRFVTINWRKNSIWAEHIMNASGFNPTCLHVLLWARLWTLQWLHCPKTQNPPWRRAWLCPSRCCRCSFRFLRLLFFSHLSRSSPLGDPWPLWTKISLGRQKVYDSYVFKWKSPWKLTFLKAGKHQAHSLHFKSRLVWTDIGGPSVTRISCLMLPFLLPEIAASPGPFQKLNI